MPRKPRFYLPEIPAHVIQRGHNKDPIFFCDQDYLEYLRCLKSSADDCGCLIHAYVLMTNHVHLLITPLTQESIGRLFQGLGRQYVRYINNTYKRSGSLWEGRHKGHIIDSDVYVLTCMRYIEMNPVRAKMVGSPAEYRWSSYAANAWGSDNAIIQPHDQFLVLAKISEERHSRYRSLFENDLAANELELIQNSLQSGTPLGNARFRKHIESVVGRSVGQIKRGRPVKRTA